MNKYLVPNWSNSDGNHTTSLAEKLQKTNPKSLKKCYQVEMMYVRGHQNNLRVLVLASHGKSTSPKDDL